MSNNGNDEAARSGRLMTATARLPAVRREGAVAIGATTVGALALGAVAMGALAIGKVAIGQLAFGQAKARRRRRPEDDLVVAQLTIRELTIERVWSPVAYRMSAAALRFLGTDPSRR
jgi:hypothetical protein